MQPLQFVPYVSEVVIMKHIKFINIILVLLIVAYVATLACCTDDGRLARNNDSDDTTELEYGTAAGIPS